MTANGNGPEYLLDAGQAERLLDLAKQATKRGEIPDPDYELALGLNVPEGAVELVTERFGLIEPVEAATNGKAKASAQPDRYQGRLLNVKEMLDAPDDPIPWRCEMFAADGYLTVLAGAGKVGKSWLALALASGVARGTSEAGIYCEKGRALIFDAENGAKLIARRFRSAGITPDLAIQPVEALGLRITNADDLGWFRRQIIEQRANLVVFDSLRVLSTGSKENDSDDMEPVITALKQLARETGAAIILIHHRGRDTKSQFRGSSVILDQTDLLFTLGKVEGDPERRTRRKLSTVGCRIDEEPEPRWLAIKAGRNLRVSVDQTEPYESDGPGRPKERDTLRAPVLAALSDTPQSGRSIAKDVDASEATVRRVLHDLEGDGVAGQRDDGWVRQYANPLSTRISDAPAGNGSAMGNEGASEGEAEG